MLSFIFSHNKIKGKIMWISMWRQQLNFNKYFSKNRAWEFRLILNRWKFLTKSFWLKENFFKFQIPKGRHFADDVNLLEFTIEYLKQTTDFQKGVGLCAKETKTFLKRHVFDRNKISALFHKIEQRIEHISKSEYIKKNNIDAVGGFFNRQITFASNQVLDSSNNTGVLLDLSMKQNRGGDETGYSYNSTATIHSLCKNLKKREILDKIRKKILDKRRMSDSSQNVEIVQNEIMWRPWRY